MERFPISIHNSGPMFMMLPNFLSYLEGDKELAKDLIAFLEDNPESSQVGITKDKVTEIRFDYKLDGGKRESWFSDSNKAAAKLRECALPIIEIFNNTFPYNSPVARIDSWDSFWITKYEPTTSLIPKKEEENEGDCADDTHYCLEPADIHYDFNSHENDIYSIPTMATLTVALNDGDEYEGGEFVISNGFDTGERNATLEQEFVTLPKSNTGDGLLIDGWTLHGVNPVTKGTRYVFLAHFTGMFKTGTPSPPPL